MTKMWSTLAGVVAVSLLGAGCLVKDDITVWYLEPSGAVTWSVIEKDVRSDAENLVDRQTEEANYIAAVRQLNHPMARGFAELGAIDVRTRILRGTVPFTVVTDAGFPTLAQLGERLLQRMGLPGTSTLTQAEVGTTWTLSVRDPHAMETSAQPDEDLAALSSGLDALKIVLTEGRFVAAEGFELSGDRRTASVVPPNDDVFKDQAVLVFTLTWR
jgi:hypothetical protein